MSLPTCHPLMRTTTRTGHPTSCKRTLLAKGVTSTKRNYSGDRLESYSWKLDRFKFLPMLEKAFATDPDAHWYFSTEVDTYFSWDTLYRLLNSLDANERHYVGSAAPGSNHSFFGYGGAGLIISRRLMHDMLHERTESLSTKYEQWAKDDCCGDALLAYVIREETGVRVQNGYPVLSREALAALGVGKDNWCMPLLTLHRVNPELMQELWRWERCRPYDEVRILSMSTSKHFR